MNKSKIILTGSLFALVSAGGPYQQPAEAAGKTHDCRKGIEAKFSGQVNRAGLYANDHNGNSDFFLVDNDNSSTRIRVTTKGYINCSWTVGTNFEVEMESNSSGRIAFNQGTSVNRMFAERKLEIWFKNAFFKFSLGQGDTASNGTSEVDLSTTGVVAYSGIADMAGGLSFFHGTGAAVAIGAVSNQFDGLSRLDRVRIDSTNIGGFMVSTSYTDRNHWDIALRFAKEFSGTKVAAAIAYANPDDNNAPAYDYQINGSLSILFPMGLNATIAVGKRKDNGAARTDPHTYYAKLGYIAKLFDLGPTAFVVDYQSVEDLAGANQRFHSYAFAVVQHIPHVGTELYAAVRQHELELGGVADPDGIWAVMTGARVKF